MQNLDRKVSMPGITRELKKVEKKEKDKYINHLPSLQQKDSCQSVFDIYEGEGTEIFIGCSKGTNSNGKPENKVEAVYRINQQYLLNFWFS